MKLRKWFMILNQVSVLGWFPFMWICLFSRDSPTMSLIVFLTGFILCLLTSFVTLIFHKNSMEVFKSVEELEILKDILREKIRVYDEASKEFLKTFIKK